MQLTTAMISANNAISIIISCVLKLGVRSFSTVQCKGITIFLNSNAIQEKFSGKSAQSVSFAVSEMNRNRNEIVCSKIPPQTLSH